MSGLSERLNTPISTEELERRWSAVREAMRVAKIDALSWICDNYVIESDGLGDRLHRFPEKITSIEI